MRAPTVKRRWSAASTRGGTSSFSPNPFLEPEIQKGWEFGANIRQNGLFARGDSFRLKADYFNMNVENYIAAAASPRAVTALISATPRHIQGAGRRGAGHVRCWRRLPGAELHLHATPTCRRRSTAFGAQSYLPDHIFWSTGGLRFFDQKLTVGTRVYGFVRELTRAAMSTSEPTSYQRPFSRATRWSICSPATSSTADWSSA